MTLALILFLADCSKTPPPDAAAYYEAFGDIVGGIESYP